MKKLTVTLKNNCYPIFIGNGNLSSIGRLFARMRIGTRAFIITSSVIKKKYGGLLEDSFKKNRIEYAWCQVPDSEASKSLRIASSVIKKVAGQGIKNRVCIVAFGGGVVGDLSGFVASIYRRGIPYLQVPTTFLAQIDSSIGGKTAVDLEEAKNLLGSFYQPKLVVADISLLQSLPPKQIRNGLAEAIKYGLIRDRKLFAYIEKNFSLILKKNVRALTYVIYRCAAIKSEIVSYDEREGRGVRTILNFGHTIGHAIEAACGYSRYTHGEAVALGMRAAVALSQSLGHIDMKTAQRILRAIAKIGLPQKASGTTLARILKAYYHDKKFVGMQNKFVLLKGIGRPIIVNDIPLARVKNAIQSILRH